MCFFFPFSTSFSFCGLFFFLSSLSTLLCAFLHFTSIELYLYASRSVCVYVCIGKFIRHQCFIRDTWRTLQPNGYIWNGRIDVYTYGLCIFHSLYSAKCYNECKCWKSTAICTYKVYKYIYNIGYIFTLIHYSKHQHFAHTLTHHTHTYLDIYITYNLYRWIEHYTLNFDYFLSFVCSGCCCCFFIVGVVVFFLFRGYF